MESKTESTCSINTYLNLHLVLLSLLESTSSSCAAVCCWRREGALEEITLNSETGHLVCTTQVQLFFPSNAEHPSLFFEGGFCLVHLHFPAECSLPCVLFKNKPFPVPYPLCQRLSQCYLATFEFSIALRAACTICLSVPLDTLVVFLSVPHHIWDFGDLDILQGKFFLARGYQCAVLPSPGSFPPKVTLAISASGRCSF